MSILPWDKVVAQLNRSQRVVLGTHASPDGDALGSELGLSRFLRSRGKTVHILNTGTLPRMYEWLPKPGEVETYRADLHDKVIAEADTIVVVDISNWERLGLMHQPVMKSPAVRIDLDHHPVPHCPADLSINDPSAAAVGDIIHRLIHHCGGTVTAEIALPLYVSLLTDTGSFKYSNTDIHSHRLAGEFIALGVAPYDVYTRIYECATPARLKLLGETLARLQFEPEARLAWTSIPHALYAATGTREEDSEGIIDQVRTLEAAETAILFKEPEPGTVKVSMRSKGVVDVNALARGFGGGGHARAAGMTLQIPLEEAIRKVLAAARASSAAHAP